jgi:hypothetical protein
MKPMISCFLLIAMSLAAAAPTPAAPLYSAAALEKSPVNVVHVAKKKPPRKNSKRSNYNASQGYIPGHVLTPYGYGDCIGWWERHPDGRMQCHGQLILNHWRD